MTDARILRNRTGLRQALLALLDSQSFEAITVRDIVGAADVGYTTFFRHYPNKEALLGDVAIEEVGRLHELTLPVYEALAPRATCLALCAYVEQHRAVWSALLAGAAGFVREEMLRLGRELVADEPSGGIPKDLASVLSVSLIVELLGWWLRQTSPRLSPAEVAEIMDHWIIGPGRTMR